MKESLNGITTGPMAAASGRLAATDSRGDWFAAVAIPRVFWVCGVTRGRLSLQAATRSLCIGNRTRCVAGAHPTNRRAPLLKLEFRNLSAFINSFIPYLNRVK